LIRTQPGDGPASTNSMVDPDHTMVIPGAAGTVGGPSPRTASVVRRVQAGQSAESSLLVRVQ